MPAATDRLDFAPPSQPGIVPAWVLALIAHALLMAALTWGIQWDRQTQAVSAVAELWSAVPQEAAPEPVVAPPMVQPPPAPPAPEPVRAPKEEAKPEPKPREPDINEAREREKAKREAARREEAKREEEARRVESDRKERERRKAEAEEKRREQEKLAAEKKRKAQQEEARLEKQRKENLDRMARLAGNSPTPSPGTAIQSSGPSGNWAGRVRARVKPNIVFTDDVAGNPSAEVEVRLAPDGTIVSRRLVKSSGHKSWDEAVLRALDKTEVLPRDTDGRVPPSGVLVFRPKD